MRQALLTCDKCGHQEAVTSGDSARGWRMVMTGEGTIAADLCPDCDAELLAPIVDRVAEEAAEILSTQGGPDAADLPVD